MYLFINGVKINKIYRGNNEINFILKNDGTILWKKNTYDYIQGYYLNSEKILDPQNITEQQLLAFGLIEKFTSPYSTPANTAQEFFCVKKTVAEGKTLTIKDTLTGYKTELEGPFDKTINGETYSMWYSYPDTPSTKTNTYTITLT